MFTTLMRFEYILLFFTYLCLTILFIFLPKRDIKHNSKSALIQESKIFLCKNDSFNYSLKGKIFNYDLPINLNQTTIYPAIHNTTHIGNNSKYTKYDENMQDDVFTELENNAKPFFDSALYHCFFNNEYIRFFSFAEQETKRNTISLYILKRKLIQTLKKLYSCKSQNFYENQQNILCFINNFLKSEAGKIAKLADLAPIYEFIQKASLKNIKLKIYIILNFKYKNQLVVNYIFNKESTTTKFTMNNLTKNKYNRFKYFIEAKKDEEIEKLVCGFE